MTREEAISCIKHELLITVNRKDLTGEAIGEALDMAIEALSEQVTCKLKNPCNALLTDDLDACKERKSKLDLISRQDAIDAIDKYNACGWVEESFEKLEKSINTIPSARQTVDCTEFMEWLKAEVLDEENWELNAVANGEIICRKFKKLGWLDIEHGFYVDARPTGEWIPFCVLPESEQGILISSPRWGVYKDIFFNDEMDGCGLYSGEDIEDDMAWMPLPEPYKGGDDNE